MRLADKELHRKDHWWGNFGVTWPKMGHVVVVVAGHGKPNIPLRTVLFQGEVFYLPLACLLSLWHRHAAALGAEKINLTALAPLHTPAWPDLWVCCAFVASVLAALSPSMLLPDFGYSSSNCLLYLFATYGEGARRSWGKGSHA